MCFPIFDSSSSINPHKYYATSKMYQNVTGGEGTLNQPYEGLAVALAKITKTVSILYLINDGDYDFAQIDRFYSISSMYDIDPRLDIKFPFNPFGEVFNLTITSLDGSIIKVKSAKNRNLIIISVKQ